MANIISDETIEYVGILAKLELSEEEKEQAKKDAANNEAWQRYYASRDASRKTSKSALAVTKPATVIGGF